MDALDLYEFPRGYAGRKTYVSVQGHSRSIPYIYTYKSPDGRNKLLPEYGGGPIEYSGRGPMIMRDISGYRSPIDGQYVSSRSAHREHMERHGVIELGNERVQPKSDESNFATIGHDIKRRLDEVKAMPQREYDNQVAQQAQIPATE